MKVKIIGLVAAVILVAALVAVASGATGAFFSDTENGKITGTIGEIQVTLSGGSSGNGTEASPYIFNWSNMLPGVVYSQTMTVQNTSAQNVEDLWINFQNLTALSTFNSLGTYGSASIQEGPDINHLDVIFQSNNLQDNIARGNHIWLPGQTTGAMPPQIKLDANVGPSQSRVVVFKFAYASKMTHQEPGGVFNKYPVIAIQGNECLNGLAYLGTDANIHQMPDLGGTSSGLYPYMNGTTVVPGTGVATPAITVCYAQTTVEKVGGAVVSGDGLPFQIIATEQGILPTDKGTSAPLLP
jgi:hypothetical protein